MRRLLIVCFTVLCVSPCGNAEEKDSGSPARGDSIADRLLAVERRIAALESRPVQHPPIQYAVPQQPPQVVAGPWGNAPLAAAQAPPAIRVAPPPQGAVGAVVPRPNALAAPFLYKEVIAKETGGEVVVAIPLGAYRDDAGTDKLKGELVIDGKDVRLIDARGKTVDKKDALIRLAKRAIVGVAVLNQQIEIDESSPPKFLKDVPEDTMVILIAEQKIAALWATAYGMNTVSAQAVLDKGEICLTVLDNRPMETVYVVREPSVDLRDDGQGEKTEAKRFTPEVRIRVAVSIEPALPRRYRVSGNKSLVVMDGTGKTLTDKEVFKALEKPAVVYEVNDKPDPELLATPLHPSMILQPDTVLLVWKDDAARSASELPAIAEQADAADSR